MQDELRKLMVYCSQGSWQTLVTRIRRFKSLMMQSANGTTLCFRPRLVPFSYPFEMIPVLNRFWKDSTIRIKSCNRWNSVPLLPVAGPSNRAEQEHHKGAPELFCSRCDAVPAQSLWLASTLHPGGSDLLRTPAAPRNSIVSRWRLSLLRVLMV